MKLKFFAAVLCLAVGITLSTLGVLISPFATWSEEPIRRPGAIEGIAYISISSIIICFTSYIFTYLAKDEIKHRTYIGAIWIAFLVGLTSLMRLLYVLTLP
jgi:hypothetical protein